MRKNKLIEKTHLVLKESRLDLTRKTQSFSDLKKLMRSFEQYDRRKVWNKGRESNVRERVLNKQTLTPILLGLADGNKDATFIYGLYDGIHRSNVLFENGYTHILATVNIEVYGRVPFIEEEIKGDREQIFKYCLMNSALKTFCGINGINIGNVYICLPNYEYDTKLSRREYRELLFTKRHIVTFAFGKKGMTNNSLEVISMINNDDFNVVLQISNETFKLNGTLDKLADELEQLVRKNKLFSPKFLT